MAPKKKRRNSEKRKEKSRDAARCRRSKESEIFSDMANLLPVSSSVSSQLDKASVMRLAIAFLKTRSLLESSSTPIEWPWMEEDEEQLESLCLPQALGGILIALTPEGDIAYLTENVTQHLGLPHMDVMGQSIYDYCHPCDHEELRNSLSLVKDEEDPLDRSFFLRFKCTLSSKSRTGHNLKAASYKVMNCSGRIMMADNTSDFSSGATQLPLSSDFGDEEDDDNEDNDSGPLRSVTESYAPTHYLVLIAESIPHPSNIDGQMDSRTFLTKHSLDMAYTHIDEKIEELLGYTAKELMSRSAYEMHHVLDHDVISKCYKTMFIKGQVQTPPYRFVARQGGYAWVQTQATLIYGAGRDAGKPQAVVCVHTCLSEIEDDSMILCSSQAAVVTAPGAAADLGWDIQQSALPFILDFNKQLPLKKTLVDAKKPQKMTSKLFQPRTADMNSGFLKFDETNGTIICKEEMDDLTHLAPTAGDSCIPLDLPIVVFPADYLMTFDPADLSPEVLDDCFPIAGFEFPILPSILSEEDLGSPELNSEKATVRSDSSMDDPFFAASSRDAEASPFFQDSPSKETEDSPSPSDMLEATQLRLCMLTDDEELNRRAPYIPMNNDDDLPIFDAKELFCDLDIESLPLPVLSEGHPDLKKESVLTKLLQQQQQQQGSVDDDDDVKITVHPPASKRSLISSNLADELSSVTIPKRFKVGSSWSGASSPSWRVDGRPLETPASPPWPMRAANTMSLLELLTEDGRNDPLQRSRPLRKTSVLENLLVGGQDPSTGHNLLSSRLGQSVGPSSLRPLLSNPSPFPTSSTSSGLKSPCNKFRKCIREGSPTGGISDDESISNDFYPNLMDSFDVFNSLDDLSLVVSSEVFGNKKDSILG